jgi:hypothetical protein
METRTEVISVLRRFVHGQLSFDELQGFVRSHNFGWLDELLDGIQLAEHDFAEIALDESVLSRPLTGYVAGHVDAEQLADWAFETYRIFSSGTYPSAEVYSPSVETSLLLACLITDCELHDLLPEGREIAHRILEALELGQPIPSETVVQRVLRKLPVCHLVTRARSGAPETPDAATGPEEGDAAEHWVDLALDISVARGDDFDPDDCWFTPLSVCSRELWTDTPPEGSWAHPENDRMHALREQFPQLDLATLEPMYFVGPDGSSEVVLDTDRIDASALLVAVRLFCLRNRVRRCTLDGVHCYPAREDR